MINFFSFLCKFGGIMLLNIKKPKNYNYGL